MGFSVPDSLPEGVKLWWASPRKMLCPSGRFAMGREHPNHRGRFQFQRSYGHNARHNGASWLDRTTKLRAIKLEHFKQSPSTKLDYSDSMHVHISPGLQRLNAYRNIPESRPTFHPDWLHAPAFRHFFDGRNGKVNSLMYDGHAEMMDANEIHCIAPTTHETNLKTRKLWFPLSRH